MTRLLLPLATSLGYLGGCGSSAVDPPTPEALQAVPGIVEGANRFACDLYRHQAAEAGNRIVGNASVWTAVAIPWIGARGETATQVAATMHFEAEPRAFHPGVGALTWLLTRELPRGVRLDVANRLWAQAGAAPKAEFLDVVRRCYGDGFETVDFARDRAEACRRINAWVAGRTRDRITDLLSPGDLDPLTQLVVTNAVYLKADWERPFDEQHTRPAAFHLDATRSVETPMMFRRGTCRYADRDGVQVLELPYAGRALGMIVVLPETPEGLPALERALTAGTVATWLEDLRPTPVAVGLPKFTVRTRLDLGGTLSSLGMPLAFSNEADFSGLVEGLDVRLSRVVHEAFVRVDERGTEAAAATGVGVAATSEPAWRTFTADRPFLFLVRDARTGLILFVGRVADPTREP